MPWNMCKHTCKRSFLCPVYVFNQRFLWFGHCLFLPHHMSSKNHRFNLILSCSVEQILGEEGKLHHIDFWDDDLELKYDFSLFFSQTCRNLSDKSHTEAEPLLCSLSPQKPAFALIFWTSSSLPLIHRRLRWRDAGLSGSFLSTVSGTRLFFIFTHSPCSFFLMSPALKLYFLLLLTSDLTVHLQMTLKL